MHKYRKQSVMFLMGYLVIFFSVMVVSIFNLNSGRASFEIGMSHSLQNWIIIVFSLFAMIKVVVEIAKVESHAEYERKLRSDIRS
jgi:hypothetical protein